MKTPRVIWLMDMGDEIAWSHHAAVVDDKYPDDTEAYIKLSEYKRLTAEVERLKESDERAHGVIHYYENKWVKERDTNQRLKEAASNFFSWFNRHYFQPSVHPDHEWCKLGDLLNKLEGEGE